MNLIEFKRNEYCLVSDKYLEMADYTLSSLSWFYQKREHLSSLNKQSRQTKTKTYNLPSKEECCALGKEPRQAFDIKLHHSWWPICTSEPFAYPML